jgi:L-2-hydroxyglutarate oxidase
MHRSPASVMACADAWSDRLAGLRSPAGAAHRALPGPAGIRAQALGRDGTLIDDFVVHRTERAVHVRNAPSPAATSSLPVARLIVDQAEELF